MKICSPSVGPIVKGNKLELGQCLKIILNGTS